MKTQTTAAWAAAHPSQPTQTAPGRRRRWSSDDEDDRQAVPATAGGGKDPAVRLVRKGDRPARRRLRPLRLRRETGKKVERTFQPIDREWESGWPLDDGWQCSSPSRSSTSSPRRHPVGTNSLPRLLIGIAFYVILQAFLVGTYETLRIRRNKKGQTEITTTWRVAFIPLTPKKVNWREHEGLAFGHYDATSVVDWFLLLLLLPACLFVAVFFWFFVIRSDRFFAASGPRPRVPGDVSLPGDERGAGAGKSPRSRPTRPACRSVTPL